MANLRAAISTNTMTLLNARISGSGSTRFSRRTALSLNWNVRVLEFRQQEPEILSQNAKRSNAVGRRKEMKAGLPWRRVQRSHMISLLSEADRWEADGKVREDGCVWHLRTAKKNQTRERYWIGISETLKKKKRGGGAIFWGWASNHTSCPDIRHFLSILFFTGHKCMLALQLAYHHPKTRANSTK